MVKIAPPPAWQERLGRLLLRALSPPLTRSRPAAPPPHLAPFEQLPIPRPERGGSLGATWYPAEGEARGAVLLVHPWVEWGQAYFHRHGRIESLRAAGYHAMTFDQSGVGTSSPPFELSDRDVADAFRALKERAPGLPLHLWAVSAGGYWAHFFLAREEGVAGAMFEDVSPHLLEWSWKVRPSGLSPLPDADPESLPSPRHPGPYSAPAGAGRRLQRWPAWPFGLSSGRGREKGLFESASRSGTRGAL